ncbi:hypothetical protein [Bradyrhizobium sp.]|uniref:hypothetical protein n=1 Tax=Bradyrhizobium sp. TaxID=376 RepID=UPI002387FD68|nr:hypothetical protein [Bradyrhizobium sp.]MDE2380178.1 hypothetical protein [Bradyrhizobium sp.]
MTFSRLSLRAAAITAMAVILAGAAVGLARPRPIENAVLGADWQCTRTALVVTTCALRPQQQAVPAVETSRKESVRPPKV